MTVADLEIGKEYNIVEIEYPSRMPFVDMVLTYLGKHPYDNRHLFASKDGGCIYVPDDGQILSKLESPNE